MFGWLSTLAGSSGLSALADRAEKIYDEVNYSPEEQDAFNLKKQELRLEFERAVNKQSLPRAKIRRNLALLVAIPYILTAVIKSIIEFLSALGIIPLVDLSSVNSTLELYTVPFTSVIFFYYGQHIVDRLKK